MSRPSSAPRERPNAPQPSAPDHPPSVLIVVINWNSARDTIACLRSVLATTYPSYSILLIDNGSTDDSLLHLRPLASDRVSLVELPANSGFTGASNLGFRHALDLGHDFVWLLNNDARAKPCTLSSLVRCAAQDPAIGLVQPCIASLENPHKYLNLGGLFRPSIPAFESTTNLELAREWARRDKQNILVMGTALLVRTDLLRHIGLFDDQLFAYWEDTDLSLRATHAGFRNAVDFHSVVLHHEKDASRDANEMKPHYWYYMARNEIRFWRKHVRGLSLLKALWWSYKFNLHNLNLLGRNPVSQQAVLAGLWDGWIGRTGAFAETRRAPLLIALGICAHARRHARRQRPSAYPAHTRALPKVIA